MTDVIHFLRNSDSLFHLPKLSRQSHSLMFIYYVKLTSPHASEHLFAGCFLSPSVIFPTFVHPNFVGALRGVIDWVEDESGACRRKGP